MLWRLPYSFLAFVVALLAPPSVGRCALIALYGSMVGVVLFGILAMTQPYSPAAGVSPKILQWLLEATL